MVSRSGYTGEDGVEVSVSSRGVESLARRLLALDGVEAAGLGARDSLRLEAGLCLHGHDIDTTTTPVEAGLAWSIQKRRRLEGGFPGADVIVSQLRDGPPRRRVGLVPRGRAPAREGAAIRSPSGARLGTVTSGAFGPTAQGPIAMGYVASEAAAGGDCGRDRKTQFMDGGRDPATAIRAAPLSPVHRTAITGHHTIDVKGDKPMGNRLYSREHEWIDVDEGIGTVGISDYAQEQLGDVVFVELPEAGRQVANGDELCVVESVKAASEVYAPVSGEVVEVNDALGDDPAEVNANPYGSGWFVRIRLADAGELDELMDEDAYGDYLSELA